MSHRAVPVHFRPKTCGHWVKTGIFLFFQSAFRWSLRGHSIWRRNSDGRCEQWESLASKMSAHIMGYLGSCCSRWAMTSAGDTKWGFMRGSSFEATVCGTGLHHNVIGVQTRIVFDNISLTKPGRFSELKAFLTHLNSLMASSLIRGHIYKDIHGWIN